MKNKIVFNHTSFSLLLENHFSTATLLTIEKCFILKDKGRKLAFPLPADIFFLLCINTHSSHNPPCSQLFLALTNY